MGRKMNDGAGEAFHMADFLIELAAGAVELILDLLTEKAAERFREWNRRRKEQLRNP